MEGLCMKNNPTGWMAFVAAYKAKHPTAIFDYKVLMQLYIRGKEPCKVCGLCGIHKMSCTERYPLQEHPLQ